MFIKYEHLSILCVHQPFDDISVLVVEYHSTVHNEVRKISLSSSSRTVSFLGRVAEIKLAGGEISTRFLLVFPVPF